MNSKFPFSIFKSDISSFICPFCLKILERPIKYRSLKIGCYDCIESLVKQDNVQFSLKEARICSSLEKDIDALRVTCENTECMWQGRKGNYQQHKETECYYGQVRCPLTCCSSEVDKFHNQLGSEVKKQCAFKTYVDDFKLNGLTIGDIENRFLSLNAINTNLVQIETFYKERRSIKSDILESTMNAIFAGFMFYSAKLESFANQPLLNVTALKETSELMVSYKNSSEFLKSLLTRIKTFPQGIDVVFRTQQNKNYTIEAEVLTKKNNSNTYLISEVRFVKNKFKLRVRKEGKWPKLFKVGLLFSEFSSNLDKNPFFEVSFDNVGTLKNDYAIQSEKLLSFMKVDNTMTFFIIELDFVAKKVVYDVAGERYKITDLEMNKRTKVTPFCWIKEAGEQVKVELVDYYSNLHV